MAEEEQEFVIVGGGIAGLAAALALKRLGVQSLVVLERAAELRTTGAALILYPNAWRSLSALGVAHKLTSVYPEAFQRGSITFLQRGKTTAVNFKEDREGLGLRAVHRKSLLEALADELTPGTIRFSSKLSSIKTEGSKDSSSTVTNLHLEDGAIIRTKVLIGCDGVQSAVAQWLGLAAPINSGRSAVRGLTVYQEGHGLDGIKQYLSQGKRAGLIPLNDKEIYWFITCFTTPREWDMAKNFAKDPSLIIREVADNLAKGFPQMYLDCVQRSDPSSLTWAPLMLRAPWAVITGPNRRGAVTVAGDAMHPMTPDLGQGGCSALDDAVVFGRCIGLHALSSDGRIVSLKRVEEGMESYVKERRWRVAGLIVGSYLCGWVQQGGTGLWAWGVGLVRDHLFYRFFYPRISAAAQYDCGTLYRAF